MQKYQISNPVLVTQISLTKVFDYPSKFHYQPVSNFPSSEKDLSFIFPENINYSEVIREIKKTAGQNLKEVKVFDIYQSAELEKKQKKSVGFRLTFQSPIKTLESKEIERMLESIVEKVE